MEDNKEKKVVQDQVLHEEHDEHDEHDSLD